MRLIRGGFMMSTLPDRTPEDDLIYEKLVE